MHVTLNIKMFRRLPWFFKIMLGRPSVRNLLKNILYNFITNEKSTKGY